MHRHSTLRPEQLPRPRGLSAIHSIAAAYGRQRHVDVEKFAPSCHVRVQTRVTRMIERGAIRQIDDVADSHADLARVVGVRHRDADAAEVERAADTHALGAVRGPLPNSM